MKHSHPVHKFSITLLATLTLLIASTQICIARGDFSKLPMVEIVAIFDELHPVYMAISSEGRTFLSIAPKTSNGAKIIELLRNNKTKTYPSARYSTGRNSIIQSVHAIKIDSKDRLWILDTLLKKFIVWDIKTSSLHRTLVIPDEALVDSSYLQDFALDEKHNKIIISDTTYSPRSYQSAFIVMDMITGEAIRMAENHEYLRPDKTNGMGLWPITIDSKQEWVYFGALNGKKIYRAKSTAFQSEASLLKGMKIFAPKPDSDVIAVDNNENVYVANIENRTIGISTKAGYKDIARLPTAQSWPDGFKLKGKYIYAVVNKNNSGSKANLNSSPNLIVRLKINN